MFLFILLADKRNMKRESEEIDSQNVNADEENHQNDQNDVEDSESNDINSTNNQTNSNQDNGPTNPPKRQRRSDDEEIRLLIPSKVCFSHYISSYVSFS
jgi:hypothetical protein